MATTSGIDWNKILPYLIAGAGTAVGAVVSSKAAGNAASTQVAGAEKAAEIQRQSAMDALNLTRDTFNSNLKAKFPYLEMGYSALAPLSKGMGFAPSTTPRPTLDSLMLKATPGASAGTANSSPTSTSGDLNQALLSADANPAMKGTSTLKTSGGGALVGAGAGATIGSIVPGIGKLIGSTVPGIGTLIGAGIGAAAGGLSGLIGRGRKEADKIVPYQNALTAEVDKTINAIHAKDAAGTLTKQDWQDAIDHITQLKTAFSGMTQDFGRAGPGARSTMAYLDPMLQEWAGYRDSGKWPEAARAKGGSVHGGRYIVGENGPEVLEMAPGAEGYVYPNEAMRGANGLPGRASGGPVSNTADLNKLAQETNWGDENSVKAYHDALTGLVRSDPGLQSQYSAAYKESGQAFDPNTWQSSYLTQNGLDYNQKANAPMATPAASSALPNGVVPAILNNSRSSVSMNPDESGALADPNAVMADLHNTVSNGPPASNPSARPWTAQLATPEQARQTFDRMDIQQWGWVRDAQGNWTHPQSGAKGYWTPDGTFINETAGMVFDPGTGKVTSVTGEKQKNPYSGMAAPYDPTPGEFLQPWQGEFNGTVPKQQFSFDPKTTFNDPGYQFRFNEGMKALERSAAAHGNLQSGATLKALTRYSQDYASNEFGKAYDRALGENQLSYGRDTDAYNRALNEYRMAHDQFVSDRDARFNKLQAIAGGGQVATDKLGSDASSVASENARTLLGSGASQAELQTQISNAIASGDMAKASALMNGLDQAGQLAMLYSIIGRKP